MGKIKFAIKVLTSEDLSFFKVQSRRSNLRAFNLNSEIFIDRFYPGLQGSHDQVLFPLIIIGPGARPEHRLARVLMGSLGSRNWDITGEAIHDPEDQPGRYDRLAENDFALMVFEGHGQPRAIATVLVSAVEDAALHADIAARFELSDRHTMIEVPEAAVEHLHASTLGAYPAGGHPLSALLSDETLEDVLFGTCSPNSPEFLSPKDWHLRIRAAEEARQRGEEPFGAGSTTTGHGDDDTH